MGLGSWLILVPGVETPGYFHAIPTGFQQGFITRPVCLLQGYEMKFVGANDYSPLRHEVRSAAKRFAATALGGDSLGGKYFVLQGIHAGGGFIDLADEGYRTL